MDNSHIATFLKEFPTERIGILDAKRHWERLRRAILSNSVTRSYENGSAIHELKLQQKSIKKSKCQLKKSFEKSIEDARSALENAELKSEHAHTTHRKEVTNMKRKMVISEHSKIVEKAFEEARKDTSRKTSIDQVASSLRLIRKMEAQHDRLRARKMRLKEAATEKLKKKKNEKNDGWLNQKSMAVDNNGQQDLMQQDAEMQWQSNPISKQQQEIDEDKYKRDNKISMNNAGPTDKHVGDLTEDDNIDALQDQDYTNNLPNIATPKDTGNERTKGLQRYHRITNVKRKLPSVFEAEVDGVEKTDWKKFELLVDILQMHQFPDKEATLSNETIQSEEKLPYLNGISNSSWKNKMESKYIAEHKSYSHEYNLPSTKNRRIANTIQGLYRDDTSGLYECNQNELKSIKRSNSRILMKINKDISSYPQLVRRRENSQWSSGSLEVEHIKDLTGSYESTISPKDGSAAEKIIPLVMQCKTHDMSYSDSLWSALTRNSSLDLVTGLNQKRNVDEIYKALRDVGLDAKAAELDQSLKKMLEDEQYLEEKQNDVKKTLQKETERIKLKEKEDLKIGKMKLAYHRYKKKEEERRKREELKRKLKTETEKRIQHERKLYREMVMLAMGNRISRNYNFSYFTRVNLKRGDNIV